MVDYWLVHVSLQITDERLNVVLAADKSLSVFNTNTGANEALLSEEHTCGVNDCAWLAENLLVSGSDDQTVKIWDIVKVRDNCNLILF